MRRTILILLLALSILPYFVGLGDNAIWDANEAFYVETPRQMIERGDYLDPSFNGRPRLNKPPLSYWIVAGFYRAFGVSVETERIAIALGALLLVATAFVIGRRAWSTDAGLMAALALASAPRVLMFARRIFIDVYIAAFMGLTLLFLVLAESQPARRRGWLAMMYVAMGLAFMTKGPMAVVLPGAVVLAWLATDRRLADLGRLMLPGGALIVAAIAVPWYAALYAEHGWATIRAFFIDENLARFAAPYDATAAGRGPLFYVPVLLTDLFPWSIFLPAALYAAVRTVWTSPAGAAERRLPLLLLAWVAVIVGFFTLSKTKQDLYIFPAVTAIAALVGGLLGPAVTAAPGAARPLVRWTALAAGTLVAVAGGVLLFLFASAARVYAIDGASLTGWAAVVAGLAAAGFALRGRTFASLATIGAVAVAMNWIFVTSALPSFRQYQPVPAMSDRIRAMAGPGARAGYYRIALPSLTYYLGRPVVELFDPSQLADTLEEGEAWVLITARDYEAVAPTLAVATCTAARAPLFDVKIGNILARKPLPELLLVTNRCEQTDAVDQPPMRYGPPPGTLNPPKPSAPRRDVGQSPPLRPTARPRKPGRGAAWRSPLDGAGQPRAGGRVEERGAEPPVIPRTHLSRWPAPSVAQGLSPAAAARGRPEGLRYPQLR